MSSVDPLQDSESHQAYLRGDFSLAATLQQSNVDQARSQGLDTLQGEKRLALYLFSGGSTTEAVDLLRSLRPRAPQDAEIPENLGVLLRQAGDVEGAVAALRDAHRLDPGKPNICDALAHCLGNLGQLPESRHFGQLSLELKDAEAASCPDCWPLPTESCPAFSGDNPAANVIAFSLWGQNPRYLRGAVRNAMIALDLYPEWTCRFYCDDSVPAPVIRQLRTLGAQVEMRPRPNPFFEGLMWRFEVIGDPAVRHFLIRDCDSVLNTRERVAVDAWLDSGRWFHAMRDFLSHTEVLLAGMWGGVNGVLPPLTELRAHFRPRVAPTRTFDQLFLRETVWPTVRQSVLIHDSVYTGCLGSVPFPAAGSLPIGWHVGQNEAAIPSRSRWRLSEAPPGDACRFIIAGTDPASVAEVKRLLVIPETLHCGEPFNLDVLARKIRDGAEVLGLSGGARDGLVTRFLLESLDAAASPPSDHSGATGGVALFDSLSTLPGIFPQMPDARLLFGIRDPRTISDVIARSWAESIRTIQQLAKAHPGRVEIIRIEDLLSQDKGPLARRRIGEFLGVDLPVVPVSAEPARQEAPMSPGQDRAREIEDEAGKWMRLLRYDCPAPASEATATEGLPS